MAWAKKKTPNAFIAACNKFKYLDVLAATNGEPGTKEKAENPASCVPSDPEDPRTALFEMILAVVQENSDEEGWVFSGDIGNRLLKRFPDFDVRNYGYKKLTPFLRSFDRFEIKEVQSRDSNSKLVYVRIK